MLDPNKIHWVIGFDPDFDDCPNIACGYDDDCKCSLDYEKVTCIKCKNVGKKKFNEWVSVVGNGSTMCLINANKCP